MLIISPRTATCICIVAGLLLSGCANSTPARFYVLSGGVRLQESEPATPKENDVSLAIGPVGLPEHLDRPQIVTRIGENRFILAEFDRWAEPLVRSFTRVLAENLSTLLSTDRVVVIPWKSSTPADYRITMDVIRFDGNLGEGASLISRWTVLGPDGNEIVPMKKSVFVVDTRREDYESLVAAMSEAIWELSREIAAAIRAAG